MNQKQIQYRKLISPDTFIGQYLDYMQDQETALDYDFWSAVWTLASVCGRDIVVDRPRAPVYLNWFVLLVAESGVTRKSTAVSTAKKILSAAIPEHHYLIETKTTPEHLEQILQQRTLDYDRATISIAVSELVTFLGKERYAAQMPTLLTDLYDSPDVRSGGGTVVRGNVYIKNVFVSFLSASTPAWLIRAVNPDVVEGGFTSRCIFVHAEKRKSKIAWPSDQGPPSAPLVARLKEIRKRAEIVKRVGMTDRALRVFTTWYKKRSETTYDPYIASFESREDAHVLRLAATLAINDETFVIDSRHINIATRCISAVKQNGSRLFASGIDPSRTLIGVDRIITILEEAGHVGIRHNELRNRTRHLFDNATTFNNVMALLHDLEMVQNFVTKKARGRSGTVWRGTYLIRDHDRHRQLIDFLHDH